MTRRGAAEIVAIVACTLALREVIGRLCVHTPWYAALSFYGMWTIALLVASTAWSYPRVVPARSAWNRRTALVIAVALLATEWLYDFKLARLIGGDITVHAPAGVWFTLNAAVIAPVVEEWLFRGVVWDAIAARSSAWFALVLTSMLFGLFHAASLLSPSWYSSAGTPLYLHALFGAVMGALRWRLGALGVGLALHMLYNLVYVITG
jgi:membrane protease YdiL (CAAX protease family)